MRCNFWQGVRTTLLVAAGLVALPMGTALAVTATTSFQNGLDGYNDTFDRIIDERGGTDEIDGSTVTQTFLDGFTSSGSGSPDRQSLIRFDNIIGNGAGQIPSGAFILNAQLELKTGTSGSASSPGPWGVSGLLAPFSSSTTYANYPAFRGPWWQDGTATRPVGNFSVNNYGLGEWNSADVRSLVQQWADGSLANNGMAVQAGFPGTSDGWQITTTGHGIDPDGQVDFHEWRPKLSVTYTTEDVEVNEFRRDLNGYAGDTMVRLDGGTNLLGANAADDDLTEDGLNIGQGFLDGFFSIGDSADQAALIKFDNVFGEGAEQAPTDVPVAKAWLVLTTGDESGNALSSGAFSAHRMLSAWDATTLHSDLDLGLTPEDGIPGMRSGADIASPALDSHEGVTFGSEIWLDVTSYLEGVRNGADDFGLAVLSNTSDGWQIHFNGSSIAEARPRLVVASSNAAVVVPTLAGDFNADGVVDAADYTVWRDNLGTDFNLGGNGNETGGSAGTVDQADYTLWKSSFGNVAGSGGPLGSGAAVPEPGTALLSLLAIAALSLFGTRKR